MIYEGDYIALFRPFKTWKTMVIDNKLIALIKLLEDPDPEIQHAVHQEISSYGMEVLPSLEFVNTRTMDVAVKEKLGVLIQQMRFEELFSKFAEWSKDEDPSLIEGVYFLSKWLDNQVQWEEFHDLFNQIKLNIWLELSQTLTAFEKIHIINSIFYNYYHFKLFPEGGLLSYNPYHLMTEHVGNKYSIALLYLAICEALDIPIFAIDVPEIIIMGYFDDLSSFFINEEESELQLQHFIDPESGFIHGYEEVMFYLQQFLKSNEKPKLRALSNKELMVVVLSFMKEDQSIKSDFSFENIKQQLNMLLELIESHL